MPDLACPLILGIGGTPRAGSTTERALAVSLRAARAEGAETLMIPGPALVLPMYAPEMSERTPEGKGLIDSLRRCDGIIIASPSYHGSLSGLMKNALDYVEDLRMDDRVYFDGLAVGVVHALRGWPTPLGAALNTSTRLFDEQGDCLDLSSKLQLETIGRQVVQFAKMQRLDPTFGAGAS